MLPLIHNGVRQIAVLLNLLELLGLGLGRVGQGQGFPILSRSCWAEQRAIIATRQHAQQTKHKKENRDRTSTTAPGREGRTERRRASCLRCLASCFIFYGRGHICSFAEPLSQRLHGQQRTLFGHLIFWRASCRDIMSSVRVGGLWT